MKSVSSGGKIQSKNLAAGSCVLKSREISSSPSTTFVCEVAKAPRGCNSRLAFSSRVANSIYASASAGCFVVAETHKPLSTPPKASGWPDSESYCGKGNTPQGKVTFDVIPGISQVSPKNAAALPE